VDEPTDRALKIQDLKRREYDSLSPEGKEVIAKRSRRLAELEIVTIAAELLNTIAEVDDKNRQYVAEVLDGKHPEFEEKLRAVMREYLDADVETSIRDFYKIKYGGEDWTKASSEPAGRHEEPQMPSAVTKASESAYEEYKPLKEEPVAQAASMPKVAPVQIDMGAVAASVEEKPQEAVTQSAIPADRRGRIAMILSAWEKKDPATIVRTDGDVIDLIMKVVDENRESGVTDEGVCKACETMIKQGLNGVQYCREALISPNREDLLRIAKAVI